MSGNTLTIIQQSLIAQLLSRGDRLSIQRGRLCVDPASGQSVPEEWLQANQEAIVAEILKATGEEAYRYETFSRGLYGPHKSSGVTLQFRSVLSGKDAYAVFNAGIVYVKGAKKGKPLPGQQFRVGDRSAFRKFWGYTGLALPPRLSMFHDFMGNLKQVLIIGQPHFAKPERLIASTLGPLSVSSGAVAKSIQPYKCPTESIHQPYNSLTKSTYRDATQTQQPQGFQPDQTTGTSNCGNTVIREWGERDFPIPSSTPPELQTHEEWLSDYDGGGN